MMNCPFCGNETKETSKFCTTCGKQLPCCPTCGKILTKRTRFCTADGTPIPEEIQALFQEQPAPANAEPAAAPALEPAPPLIVEPTPPQNTCARCGKPAAEGRKLCDECRAALLAARKAQRPAACTRCGQPAEAGQSYCAQCRQTVEAMQGATVVIPTPQVSHFCTQCGKTVAQGEHICAECQAAAAAQTAPKAAPKPAPKVAPERKKNKKKGGAIAMAIVLAVLVLGLVGVLVYAIAAGDLLTPPTQTQSHKDDKDDKDDDKTKEDDEDSEDGQDSEDGEDGTAEGDGPSDAPTEAPDTISCTALKLEGGISTVELFEEGQSYTLPVIVTPADTSDELSFRCSDNTVATVDKNGKVTAVADGVATITITCGDKVLEIEVICNLPAEMDSLAYFVDNCDKIQFTSAALEGFDKEMARIARNAIFAKSGRKFNDQTLQAYYEQFDWYEPKYEPSSFDTSLLNSIQNSNLVLVTDYETARGWR